MRYTAIVNGVPVKNKNGQLRRWGHPSTAFKQAFHNATTIDPVTQKYIYPFSVTICIQQE